MARGPVREFFRLHWIRLHRASYWRYYRWKRGVAEPEIALLGALCNRERLSIDVGANIGLYSHPLLEHSAGCISFEPLPPLAAHLARTFRHDLPRFRLERCALSDQAGRAELRMPQGNFGYSTMEPENKLEGKVDTSRILKFDVETRRVDDFAFENVGFLKVDVEGHEGNVLEGARELLSKQRPNVLVEVEERHKKGSVAAVHALLQELGFSGWFLNGGRLHPFSTFQLEQHQNPQRPRETVRNFLFLPVEHEEATIERLKACLATL